MKKKIKLLSAVHLHIVKITGAPMCGFPSCAFTPKPSKKRKRTK